MAPRRSEATQSQATGSRRRREVSASEDESEAEYADHAEDGVTQGGSTDKEIDAMAAQMIRYALFMEYKKKPMIRGNIVSSAFPSHGRSFNKILSVANQKLRDVFGMEIVELRAKHKLGQAGETLGQTQKGKGRSTNGQAEDTPEEETQPSTEKRTTKSNTYILRSTLPKQLVEMMNDPRPLPHIEYEPDESREDEDHQDSGALLRWEKGDATNSGHIALMGIRTVILSLVLCSGRVIQDDHLHALLRRLNLERDTILPYNSTDNKEPSMTLDKYLELLAKQLYLEKTKIMGPNGQEEGSTIEWRWGSREAEFSEEAAAAFIEAIFLEQEEAEEEEAEEDGGRSRRERRNVAAEREAKKKRLRLDIAKAAGSELQA